jgi:3-isopropylmalate dehydrogenase
MPTHKIAVLPGDGIGQEVIPEARKVLDVVSRASGASFEFESALVGGAAIDATGDPLPAATLALCERSDAILFGSVGGPKWDDLHQEKRPERGLLGLRKELDLFANLRPATCFPMLVDASPLKRSVVEGTDLMVIRELTGGLYFGQPKGRDRKDGHERAVDTLEYHDFEVRRVVELAFRLAQARKKKVTSVDKANVLESSRLWRQIATEIGKANPGVALDHMLVDTAAMRLVTSPATLDVVVTENMFGDILTDEASVLAGSMGMLPSASIGEKGPGLYEPIHGSAPDIAGKGIANPVGTILSAAMLLRHSLGLAAEAKLVEDAVDRAISEGCRSRDLGGALSTRQMADEIVKRLGA